MSNEDIYADLIRILPHWHYKVERSIKKKQKTQNISYETYFCLLILEKDGLLHMRDIANRLRLSKQQATQMIDKLVQYQLVERTFDSHDRRCVNIMISNQGKLFLIENPLDASIFMEQLQVRLTESEQQEFSAAIHVLLSLLQKID